MSETASIDHVEIVPYDPDWTRQFDEERARIAAHVFPPFIRFEHVGSTAIPNQRAKPIIDMIASIHALDETDRVAMQVAVLGYVLIGTGMKDRLFFRKPATVTYPCFHLHVVEQDSWEDRNERLLRDYLLEHPAEVEAYSQLKEKLAEQFREDSLAYTKAKTTFIQRIVDAARDARGLPRVKVWE